MMVTVLVSPNYMGMILMQQNADHEKRAQETVMDCERRLSGKMEMRMTCKERAEQARIEVTQGTSK